MTEEHKTRCISLPAPLNMIVWIEEDEYTQDTKTISTWTEKDDSKDSYE